MASCPHLAGLTELILHACWIRDAGARALAESPYLSRLQRLDLASNGIGDDGATALAESPSLANLEMLDLSWRGYPGFLEGPIPNRISRPVQDALRARFGARVCLKDCPEA
jgi:hypothetical protein